MDPRFWIAFLFALAPVVFGGWFVWADRAIIVQAFKSYRWPSVEGIVQDWEDRSFAVDGICGTAGTGIGGGKFDEIAYIYDYVVDGKRYRSSNYCFGGNVDKSAPLYHVAQCVAVYYDPGNPANAVLKRGVTAGSLIGLVMIVTGAACGTWLLMSR